MEKRELLCTAGGNVNWYSYYGKQYRGPSKIKNGTTTWSSNSTSGFFSEETKNTNSKRCTPMFIVAWFTIAKIWKQHKCPSIGEWIKRKWYTHTMEYYSAIKKNEILPFVTIWMDVEGMMLNQISQTEKDKHYMISFRCGI